VVYKSLVPFKVKRYDLTAMKTPRNVQVKLNIGNPGIAFQSSFLPNNGVGLARLEFIIAESIKIHPLALINYETLPQAIRRKVAALTHGYADKKEYYVSKLAEGIGQIAAAFYPKEVLVRFSDFKTNEYRALVGGSLYEPHEENPMLGWRGSSRYYDPHFAPAFALECEAVKRVRETFGLTNVAVMLPFTRTTKEVKKVLAVMKQNKLPRQKSLRVFVMCELPVNVIQAKEFLSLVDGYSIGSNDLTQLVMGVDRDSTLIRHLYDERHPAVLHMIKKVVTEAKSLKKGIGFCGQAPSDYPELGKALVKWGITSISVTPDAMIPLLKALKK
jgi:pyruvate,water dikinase